VPVIVGRLEPEGALVEVLISASAGHVRLLRHALAAVPAPVPARALIDTGAEASCVDPAIITALNLPLGGITLANTPALGGLASAGTYAISLTVVHPSGNTAEDLVVPRLLVLDIDLALLGYQALIGRDLLAQCDFLYSGPRGRFRLRY
jgi:hypothetical protein